MISKEIENRVSVLVNQLIEVANQRFATNLSVPIIFYDCNDTRGGWQQGNNIHLNPVLLKENFEDFLNNIVPHEVAHYVQYRVNFLGNGERSKPHGREWKYIMRVFGVIPKRTHNYDVTNTTQRIFRKFPVYCGCSVHEVTLKLINKIKNGKKYKCLKCKDRISLEKPLTSQLQSV